jgi:carboxypeptidase family protein
MRGFLYVTDELTAVSGPDGAFKLDGVPPGTYQLKVWHEALKTAAPVTVTVKEGTTATVNLTLVK